MSDESATDVDDEDLPGEELEDDQVEESASDAAALVTTDARLAFEDADSLGRRRPLEVVLLAGEVLAGKTTALVALWEKFMLSGRVGPAQFAGSVTALGFERRAWLSRLRSRGALADTERTFVESSGWLHLRLATDGTLREKLISDLAGEHFREIREGVPADEVIPDLSRVDQFVLLVDGVAIADSARRQTSLQSSRRLLDAFRDSRMSANVRIAVVLAKADALSDEAMERFEPYRIDLLKRAGQIAEDPIYIRLAARPSDNGEAEGLDELATFLVAAAPPLLPQVEPDERRADRMIGRFR